MTMRILSPLKNRKITKVLSASIIALAVSSGASFAADATWTGFDDTASAPSDVWTNGGPLNFTVGGVPSVFTSGDNAFFNDTATGFFVTPDLSTPPTPAAITVNNSSNNYTFNAGGALSGTIAFTKSGTGELTISGNNNTFKNGDDGPFIQNGAVNVASFGSGDGLGEAGPAIIVGAKISEVSPKPGALGEGRDIHVGGGSTAGTINYSGPSDFVYRGIKAQGTGATVNVMNASSTLDLRYFQVDTTDITKTGPGTLIFHGGSFGNSGYKMLASEGTLLLTNEANRRTDRIGAEALSGATFGGSGSMNAAPITIRTGGTFQPGIREDAIYLANLDFEALTNDGGVGSTVVFEAGSKMRLDLLTTASDVTSSTHLSLDITANFGKNSTLQFDGALTLELANPNNITPLLTDKFLIVDGSVAGNYIGTPLSGANVTIDLANSGFAFAVPGDAGNVVYDTVNNDIYITGVVAVPEPSTIATLLGGIGTLIGFRRLGRRKVS